jgi:hypothetical protein
MIPDQDSHIKSVETINTGGHIYNDVITLYNGTIIRISDDCICVFKNEQAEENYDPISTTYY